MKPISDLRFQNSDWLNVRRTLVCRASPTTTAVKLQTENSTHDKLKFVGHSANLKSEILNLQSFYASA